MSDSSFTRWVDFPADGVTFESLPEMMAAALHDGEFARAAATMTLEEELPRLVVAGRLIVRDPLGRGPHSYPSGAALRRALVLPEDARAMLAERGIGMRVRFPEAGQRVSETTMRPEDWLPYRLRLNFNLFELSCLLHREDPERLHGLLWSEWTANHPRATGEAREAVDSANAFLACIFNAPEMMLGDAQGATLKTMKKDWGAPSFNAAVSRADAARLVADLGMVWPDELGPVQGGAAGANDAPTVKTEAPEQGQQETPTPRPMQKQAHQEAEILRVLRLLGHDPSALPRNVPGKPGVKAAVRGQLSFSVRVFDKAWDRLRAAGGIADA